MPGQGMGGGMTDPSQMQFSQQSLQPLQQQQMQPMQGGGRNPYASNFTNPTVGDSGSAVGQDAAGNNSPQAESYGGLPISYRQLVALNFIKPELAKNIFDMAQAKIKGVERDEGKYYIDPETGKETYNPHLDKGMVYNHETKQAMPIQGYAEGMAQMAGMKAGAEKAAELPTLLQQKAADNMQVHEFKEVIGADGKPTIMGINRAGQPVPTGLQPLPKDTNKALTETQGNALAMGTRMMQAASVLNALEDKVQPWQNNLYSYRGLGRLTGSYVSPEAGQYAQAQDQWIASTLRKESGASISPSEMDNYRNIYFPQVGDSQATRQQKAAARAAVERGVMAQAGPGASLADGIVGSGQMPQASRAQGVPIAGGIVNQGQAPQATNPQVEAKVQQIMNLARSQGHQVDENVIRAETMKALGLGG